jgi:hypothetical protein
MTRILVRAMVLTLALAILAAVPAAAQGGIKKGVDFWRTPADGTTRFNFPHGDVESLCKAAPSSNWNHQIALRGVPAQGTDWDTAVARLDHAKFDPLGNAVTRVQVQSLTLSSISASDTPCGTLWWTVRLAKGPQPITVMQIDRIFPTSGVFAADLALRVEMQANSAATGLYVGSLFYDIKLPDPGGTPWSFGAGGTFRPGMDAANDCIDVLRDKLGTFPPGSSHHYFISDLIALGLCRKG